jgi:hypothetical protein
VEFVIAASLQFSEHCAKIIKKANQVQQLGLAVRHFQFHGIDVIVPMYRTLVKPVLEHANSVWNPWLRKNIDNIERVQRRATRSNEEVTL